jgi:hypothetical protein
MWEWYLSVADQVGTVGRASAVGVQVFRSPETAVGTFEGQSPVQNRM